MRSRWLLSFRSFVFLFLPGVAGFCGVEYPLFDAVDDEDEEETVEDDDEASDDSDIGLSRLRSQSPLVEAALDPGLLPVGVETVDVTGEAATDATGM